MLIHRTPTQRTQQGVTLIELMIGITVGLIILLGVLSVYLSTIQSSSATLKSIKLNQEVSAAMGIMASDIARAGYWENADTMVRAIDTVANPFTTDLTVLQVSGANDCIMFTYDYDRDGAVTLNTDDIHGYRLNTTTNTIQMIQSIPSGLGSVDTSDCDSVNWQNLTDERTTQIQSLTFTINDKCSNVDQSATVDNGSGPEPNPAYDCTTTAPASGEVTVTTREVVIDLTAALTDDPDVKVNASESVKVRNDIIKVGP